jgi:phage terminase large subunit GpA-like protein
MKTRIDKRLAKILKRAWTPPPDLTVSEWADRYRQLPSEASAEPGKWRTDKVPYLRAVMDAYNDPAVRVIALMFSAQSAKTEAIINCMGYAAHLRPGPMMVIQPTKDLAKAFMKDRFEPTIRDTPVLRDRMTKAARKKRRTNNEIGDDRDSIYHKRFPGGQLTVIGANSPSQLASRPIRDIFADEIDRWPLSVGKSGQSEGDPFSLAQKRQTTFWSRKTMVVSTPTVKGISRIEGLFESGDMNRLWVPCHECGSLQTLKWACVEWPDGQPEMARYRCEHCDALWDDRDRRRAVAIGTWIPDAPEKSSGRVKSFHLNAIASPWTSMTTLAMDFIEAKKGGIDTLRTFINTALAETFDASGGEVLEHAMIKAREEEYATIVPKEVLYLTAAVDVQQDRLEFQLMGHGLEFQKFIIGLPNPNGGDLLAPIQIWGSPMHDSTWKELDKWLVRGFPHGSGKLMPISLTLVDSGDGNMAEYVLKYTKARQGHRVFACRGASTPGSPLVGKQPTEVGHARAKVFLIGTDTAKDMLFDSMKHVPVPGPGYIHFPQSLGDEFYKQLTGEKSVIKFRQGVKYRRWTKIRERNEALDLVVYNLGAGALVDISNPQAVLDAINRGVGIPGGATKARYRSRGVGE